MALNRPEKAELSLVACAVALSVPLRPWLPTAMAPGLLILSASGLLLFQGLLRDLWIKYGTRPDGEAGTKILCMCMESTIGTTGVIAGAAALLGGLGGVWSLPGLFWPLFALGVGSTGFLIKDLIIDVDHRSIRREKGHRSIIVW